MPYGKNKNADQIVNSHCIINVTAVRCIGTIILHGLQRRMISVVIFFVFLRLLFVAILSYIYVAICELLQAVDATYGIP